MTPRINPDATPPKLPAQPSLRRSDLLHEATIRKLSVECLLLAIQHQQTIEGLLQKGRKV